MNNCIPPSLSREVHLSNLASNRDLLFRSYPIFSRRSDQYICYYYYQGEINLILSSTCICSKFVHRSLTHLTLVCPHTVMLPLASPVQSRHREREKIERESECLCVHTRMTMTWWEPGGKGRVNTERVTVTVNSKWSSNDSHQLSSHGSRAIFFAYIWAGICNFWRKRLLRLTTWWYTWSRADMEEGSHLTRHAGIRVK